MRKGKSKPASAKLPSGVRRWRAFVYTLGLTRFSIIVLSAVLALLWVPQGQDLLRSIDEDAHYFLFLLFVFLWGSSIWFCTRTLLDVRYPAPPYPETRLSNPKPSRELRSYNFQRKYLPRLLGLVAFVAVASMAYKAGATVLAMLVGVCGIAFWALVVYRRKLTQIVAPRLGVGRGVESIDYGRLPPYDSLTSSLQGYRMILPACMFVLGIVFLFSGSLSPYTLGWFGAPVLLFFWAATFLPLGSLVSYYSNKKGIPLLLLGFAAAGVFSCSNDNHDIRSLSDKPADKRSSIAQSLRSWYQNECENTACDKPFVILATAGGGIRAAYWTAIVLGELSQRSSHFSNGIYAISGVSGGSVGATVFYTVDKNWESIKDSGCGPNVAECTLRILEQDTLGALTASLLSSDLIQRFLPIPMLPDRARAFEQAWEKNYFNATGQNHLAEHSLQAFSGTRAYPELFLNSVWSDNGRRIVASTSDISGSEFFQRNNDLLAVTGKTPRLSTAMHNSARFPFASPPGSWKEAGKISGRVMDGGLYENYGAETAMEIMQAARGTISHTLDIRVVLITSDPGLPDELADSVGREPINFAHELMGTVSSYINTRTARGAEAVSRLRNSVDDSKFVHLRMCKSEGSTVTPPLGWSLSDDARETIKGYLVAQDPQKNPCRAANMAGLAKVAAWLDQ